MSCLDDAAGRLILANVVNNRRGRPSGSSDVAERVLSAARKHFLAHGYADTSARSIAREAGVSHTLVNYHFGGKGGLFAAVLDLVMGPGQVLDRVAGEHEGPEFASRLLTRYVIGLEPIASMSREEVVRYVSPSLQASLSPRPWQTSRRRSR